MIDKERLKKLIDELEHLELLQIRCLAGANVYLNCLPECDTPEEFNYMLSLAANVNFDKQKKMYELTTKRNDCFDQIVKLSKEEAQ